MKKSTGMTASAASQASCAAVTTSARASAARRPMAKKAIAATYVGRSTGPASEPGARGSKLFSLGNLDVWDAY